MLLSLQARSVRSLSVLRTMLRIIAVGSIAMVIVQLAIASRNLESPTNDAVRLAGLGLPVLFLAFLNLIVWTQEEPKRNTRYYTHFANGLLLVASALVAHSVAAAFAFAVIACTAVVAVIAVLFELHFQKRARMTG